MTQPTFLTFTVPLGRGAHQLAEQFFNAQPWYKAKQVYLNTLAIYAVRFYLKCMGIEADWENSDSYNPIMLLLLDTADLEIPDLGKLECRPVLPGEDVVRIPQDGWLEERIGYVAVQLDESMREATLLGFVETVSESEEISISQLRSLKELRRHLYQLSQPEPTPKMRANLSLWLQNMFEPDWRSLEAIFGITERDLFISFRSVTPRNMASVKRAKLISLGLQLLHQCVTLLIIVTKSPERSELTVRVQLHPVVGETYLPPNVKLALLSESGSTLDDAESRSWGFDNFIQLYEFEGLPGECFSIRVAYKDTEVTENFVF